MSAEKTITTREGHVWAVSADSLSAYHEYEVIDSRLSFDDALREYGMLTEKWEVYCKLLAKSYDPTAKEKYPEPAPVDAESVRSSCAPKDCKPLVIPIKLDTSELEQQLEAVHAKMRAVKEDLLQPTPDDGAVVPSDKTIHKPLTTIVKFNTDVPLAQLTELHISVLATKEELLRIGL